MEATEIRESVIRGFKKIVQEITGKKIKPKKKSEAV